MLTARSPRSLLAALSAPVLFLSAGPARACSVCACGDPIVAAAEGHGEGAGDLRVAVDTEHLTQEAGAEGEPGHTDVLDQYTLRLTGVYSPIAPLNLVVAVPLVRKKMSMEQPDGPTVTESDETGLGDVEVGARWFVLESVNFGARRRQGIALSAGTAIPTGPNDAKDDAGERIDEHGQLGTGGWGPYAGISYRLQQDPWSALVAVSGRVRTENGDGYRYGEALLWTVQGQWSPVERVALGLGLDGRNVAHDRDDAGRVENTGGLVLALTPSAYVNVFRGLWLNARAQLPFLSRVSGRQTIGPTVAVGISYQVM
jgi:hypothetical protein